MAHLESVEQRRALTILDQPVDLRATMRGLLDQHRSYLVLLMFTIILDAVSTIAFMSLLGPGAEQNPLVRGFSYSLGIIVGPLVGKVFQLIAAFGLSIITPRLARLILATVILMNLFAFVVNMSVFGRALW